MVCTNTDICPDLWRFIVFVGYAVDSVFSCPVLNVLSLFVAVYLYFIDVYTVLFKRLVLMFFKEVSSAHHGCICLI